MLGEKIKELRIARKLNQVELAAKLGVSKQTVSNWENNNIQPSIDTLIKISTFFKVTTDYLLNVNTSGHKLDVKDLTLDEVRHIQAIIEDIRKHRR